MPYTLLKCSYERCTVSDKGMNTSIAPQKERNFQGWKFLLKCTFICFLDFTKYCFRSGVNVIDENCEVFVNVTANDTWKSARCHFIRCGLVDVRFPSRWRTYFRRAAPLRQSVNDAKCYNVGFDVPTAVVRNSSMCWYITVCVLLEVTRHFGGTSRLHLQSWRRRLESTRMQQKQAYLLAACFMPMACCMFHDHIFHCLFFVPWRWMRNVSLKRRLTFSGVHGIFS
jgi:hypothetical protein